MIYETHCRSTMAVVEERIIMNELLKIIGENFTSLLIFLFAIVFFTLFHKQIGEALSRLTKVSFSKSKIEFGDQSASQSLTDTKSNPKDTDEKLYVDPWLSPILVERENNIWEHIEEKYHGQSDDPLVKLLVRRLASAHIREEFEFCYSHIYGSQIRLLKTIKQRSNSMPQDDITVYFQEVQETSPDIYRGANVNNYLTFLLNNLLIEYQEESYSVTVLGTEFLAWMARLGRAENKPW